MNGTTDGMYNNTTGWFVSTSNNTFFNQTQADDTDAVDEYVSRAIQRFQYVNLAVRLIMGLIAFFTNLLTIVAIASFEYLRSCTNYLIAYLAFADMMAGINSIFLVTNYLTPMSDYMWSRMCAIELSLSYTTAGFNVLAIFGISLDRLIFVTFPLRYHAIVTSRATVIYISCCVVLMIAVIGGVNCCGYNYIADRICIGKVSNLTTHMNVMFYIFSILIILPNIRIAYIAYKQNKAIALGQAVSDVSRKQNKITKMLSMVLGVYYGCYVPQTAVLIILGFFPSNYGVIIERTSSWFWWVNSWSNPPIYAWKNKAFNKAFRSLLGMRSAIVDPALD